MYACVNYLCIFCLSLSISLPLPAPPFPSLLTFSPRPLTFSKLRLWRYSISTLQVMSLRAKSQSCSSVKCKIAWKPATRNWRLPAGAKSSTFRRRIWKTRFSWIPDTLFPSDFHFVLRLLLWRRSLSLSCLIYRFWSVFDFSPRIFTIPSCDRLRGAVGEGYDLWNHATIKLTILRSRLQSITFRNEFFFVFQDSGALRYHKIFRSYVRLSVRPSLCVSHFIRQSPTTHLSITHQKHSTEEFTFYIQGDYPQVCNLID